MTPRTGKFLAVACLSMMACDLASTTADSDELSGVDESEVGTGTTQPDSSGQGGGEGGSEATKKSLGQHVFDVETFDGNGRTCLSCHLPQSGTLAPADIEALFQSNPSDPLFSAIDADEDDPASFSRLRERATILAGINLADSVSILGDPSARSVKLPRGILTTLNSPAFDPVVMWEGREPNIESQAEGAVNGHAEPGRSITEEEKEAVADFERTDRRFFSSGELFRAFNEGGAMPTLPIAYTEEEIRGRTFFEEDGLCGSCHGGPMLNETTASNTRLPVGTRFTNVRVSEFNASNLPVRAWVFTDEDGSETLMESSDPGRALVTGDVDDVGSFKIPSLWGINKTAPYFHDNSALTLKELVDHYVRFFASFGRTISTDDQAAVLAYLRLF